MCDQKSRDRAKLRLVTTNQLPDLPELHLQSLSAPSLFLKGVGGSPPSILDSLP